MFVQHTMSNVSKPYTLVVHLYVHSILFFGGKALKKQTASLRERLNIMKETSRRRITVTSS
jgi:hypothetical protein